MTKPISDWLMLQFSQCIATQMGLDFPKARWHDLERGMRAAAREFGFNAIESCIQWLLSAPLSRHQIEILAGHLTIGESYFLRDRQLFDLLEGQILPELIHSRRKANRRLRFWSAGCSTGEEAYSLAILLSRLLPDLNDWNVTILATDINQHGLRRAAAGVYSQWSFRDVAPGLQERYFAKTQDGRFALSSQIKRMVTFSYLNLAENAYPSLQKDTNDMDIIFCRNVLLYFAAEPTARVVSNMHNALAQGGWLVMNPSEIDHTLFSAFDAAHFAGVILYRKHSDSLQSTQRATKPDERGQSEKELPFAIPLLSKVSMSASEPDQTSGIAPVTPYDEALIWYQQGHYTETVKIALATLVQGVPDSKMSGLLAWAYANLGQQLEALAWCERSLMIDKLDPVSHYLRATILQEHGRLDEAVRSLHHAIYLDQHFILAHFALGHLAWRQARPREAFKHWRNTMVLLAKHHPEDRLLEADGLTVGELRKILHMILPLEMEPWKKTI